MYVYAEVYEPLATSTQPVVAAVSFFRGKAKVFETEPLIVRDGLNPKSKALPIRFAVPLNKLKPGFKYTCQVTLLDPAAQKRSYTRADVFVTP
jgi:hypothetical protein